MKFIDLYNKVRQHQILALTDHKYSKLSAIEKQKHRVQKTGQETAALMRLELDKRIIVKEQEENDARALRERDQKARSVLARRSYEMKNSRQYNSISSERIAMSMKQDFAEKGLVPLEQSEKNVDQSILSIDHKI